MATMRVLGDVLVLGEAILSQAAKLEECQFGCVLSRAHEIFVVCPSNSAWQTVKHNAFGLTSASVPLGSGVDRCDIGGQVCAMQNAAHEIATGEEALADGKGVNVGIIGAGRIGIVHLEALAQCENANPVIISNPTIAKAEKAAKAYKLPEFTSDAMEVTILESHALAELARTLPPCSMLWLALAAMLWLALAAMPIGR